MLWLFLFFFFFSSRRRHTRLHGDWSSDVCSSDLARPYLSDTAPKQVKDQGMQRGRRGARARKRGSHPASSEFFHLLSGYRPNSTALSRDFVLPRSVFPNLQKISPQERRGHKSKFAFLRDDG